MAIFKFDESTYISRVWTSHDGYFLGVLFKNEGEIAWTFKFRFRDENGQHVDTFEKEGDEVTLIREIEDQAMSEFCQDPSTKTLDIRGNVLVLMEKLVASGLYPSRVTVGLTVVTDEPKDWN